MSGPASRRSWVEGWQQKQRRGRLAKAEAGSAWTALLLDYRLAVGLVSLVLTSLFAYASCGYWGPPFAYRKGQRFDREIRAKVDFTTLDEQATQQRSERAAAAVYPILRHNPSSLQELRDRLTQLFRAARSGTPGPLDPATVRYWALSEQELRDLGSLFAPTAQEVVSWLTVQPVPLSVGTAASATAVLSSIETQYPIKSDDDLRLRIENAFADLLDIGVLDDDKELPEAVRQTSRVTVLLPDGTEKTVLLEQVARSRLVGKSASEKGPLYLQFARAFKQERWTQVAYRLVLGDGKNWPSRLVGTLTYDEERTNQAREKARNSVLPEKKVFRKGTPLVEQGKPLDEKDLALLREEHQHYLDTLTPLDHIKRYAAMTILFVLLGSFLALFLWRFYPRVMENPQRLIGLASLIVISLCLALVVHREPLYAAIGPLTVGALLIAIVYDQPLAMVCSYLMAPATAVSLGTDTGSQFLIIIAGLTVTILMARNIRTRSRLVHVGLYAGLAYALATAAVGMLQEQTWSFVGYDALRRFLLGMLSSLFVFALLPLLERAFGIVTDMTLLELSDVNHPLLRELVRRAQGTYAHSMTVATLAESAAEAIGANSLLARVGACFHDVGKMLKPQYFVENQQGENPHEGLAPAMSTLILIGHVKDGVELARQYRLPQAVIDFIQQHHGTSLVEFFYREAIKNLENGNSATELEASFRYPGPKPQTKEIAVVMLADAVESAARSLPDRSPSSLRRLVHDLLQKRLLDGQFDESNLTLNELRTVEESLCKSLVAMYHTRVRYSEAGRTQDVATTGAQP
ncbi:MAG: hypothetical protein C4297_06295 [Gemmataceae bacterium]